MVGLGETPSQVQQTIADLYQAGCDIITIGQYLQSGPKKLLVKEFVVPAQFKLYEEYGHSMGVKQMYCGHSSAQVITPMKSRILHVQRPNRPLA